jgi:hypothetical protein
MDSSWYYEGYEEFFKNKFFRRVRHMENGCMIWTGFRSKQGYGQCSYRGKRQFAHRVAWQITNGYIPTDHCVCHSCDVPGCVNPAHLFVGTLKENTQDSVKKGRWHPPKGINHFKAKLTEEDVRKIRRSSRSQYKLAILYGVSQVCISSIVHRKTWAHVE